MAGQEQEKINIVEILIEIKSDVSAIKTDMSNLKEAQKLQQKNTEKDISDVRTDFTRALNTLEDKVMNQVLTLRTIQNNLVGDVDSIKGRVSNLEQGDEKKDAKKWRTAIGIAVAGISGMALAKLPDFIVFLIQASKTTGS